MFKKLLYYLTLLGLTLSNTTQVNEVKDSLIDVVIDKVKKGIEFTENGWESYEEVTLVAVGDNLIHTGVFNSGKQSDGSYTFEHLYSGISDYISQADIAVINQETMFTEDDFSGYPLFSGPAEIGLYAYQAGFDIITHATNHSYDKGLDGINYTLNFWNSLNVPVLGIYDSQEAYDTVYIHEIKGIKIAMLNYTYGLNGLKIPKDKQYLVTLLNNEEKILKDLQYAEANADLTIVFPHWGTEYTHKPTKEQKRLAQLFADNGADLIIGSHPHVIEPLEYITSINGNQVPCYYSLGNFMSAQNEVPRVLGGLAEVKIVKTNGVAKVESCIMKPLVTHYEYGKVYTTYFLEDYSDDLASRHGLSSKGLSFDKLWTIWNDVYKENN